MIQAKFILDESKNMVTLKVKGHAGAAEAGSDIICASASILAYTLAQNIKYAYAQDMLKYRPTIKLSGGDCNISCRANKDNLNEVLNIYLVIQTGYQLLAHNYPSFVGLEMFARD